MRLIDADEVLETLERIFKKYSLSWLPDNENGGSAYAIPNAIKNIPTAYDVDKVIEQLSELERPKYCCKCKYREQCDDYCTSTEPDDEIDLCEQVLRIVAIEIIKRGGVND